MSTIHLNVEPTLHALRVRHGVSQQELAEGLSCQLGRPITQSHVSRCESATETVRYSADEFLAAILVLDVSMSECETLSALLIDSSNRQPDDLLSEIADDSISTSLSVTEQLRYRIVGRQLEPGFVFLPSDLMKSFGVSEAEAARALDQLADDGLVKKLGSEAIVTRDAPEVVRRAFKRRAVLENEICERIFASKDSVAIHELNKIHAEMSDLACKKSLDALFEFASLDISFHQTLAAVAGLPEYSVQLGRLIRMVVAAPEGAFQDVIQEHQQLLDSIVKRDEASYRDAMVQHLREAASRWKAHFWQELDRYIQRTAEESTQVMQEQKSLRGAHESTLREIATAMRVCDDCGD